MDAKHDAQAAEIANHFDDLIRVCSEKLDCAANCHAIAQALDALNAKVKRLETARRAFAKELRRIARQSCHDA